MHPFLFSLFYGADQMLAGHVIVEPAPQVGGPADPDHVRDVRVLRAHEGQEVLPARMTALLTHQIAMLS